ncbi:TAXI family TRAP transporter solute-binding subunit [uncultured Ramlibacter sp.]|uniref:TAXI family TRAP transporter solute-binding subunit n=1 Tax=uncultured Ramlibacter sp. TaxID=260755 RepID=UPI00262BDC95|nr:TAXI family TRAP transporter solute-binding subunit [uncultured Ramlibacter sp.]
MRRLAVLLLLSLLAACSRGPDPKALQQDVAGRLAVALPAELLVLADMARRGSQSDPKAPAGQERRIIYFDADLKLNKDYDFGGWESPGVAGVVSAMGTGPKGLVGVVNGGNKAGDVIRAHGSATYKREGESWVLVAPPGHGLVTAPEFASGAPRPAPEKMLEAMRGAIANAPPETSAATREVILQELEGAHAAIQARLARAAQGYAIAAGASGGQYLRLAQSLDGSRGRKVTALTTAGGEENLRMVRDGRAPMGLAQGDSALLAFQGKGPFAQEGPYSALRAIGSLYPEAVHVLVRGDGALRSVADLAGKRVAIGVPGSASRSTALAVLQAHGFAPGKLAKTLELPLNEALSALQNKEIDALVQVIGFPADSLREAAGAMPLRLLPLDAAAVQALAKDSPAFFPLTLAKGTYPDQDREVRTVAVAAILLAGAELTDAEVATVTRFIFEAGTDLAARGSAQGAQVSAANARLGLAVPLHPGAARVLDALAPPKPAQ